MFRDRACLGCLLNRSRKSECECTVVCWSDGFTRMWMCDREHAWPAIGADDKLPVNHCQGFILTRLLPLPDPSL